MQMPDVERIKKYCEAATDGPWYAVQFADFFDIMLDPKYDSRSLLGPLLDDSVSDRPPLTEEQFAANADFSAQSRQDLPACVAYIEQIRDTVLAKIKACREYKGPVDTGVIHRCSAYEAIALELGIQLPACADEGAK